jgi:hypothetical protein
MEFARIVASVGAIIVSAATVLDLLIGWASGSLQLCGADRSFAPRKFRMFVMAELGLTVGATAWLAFAAPA